MCSQSGESYRGMICVLISCTIVITWIRYASIRDELCEKDAEGPDIGFDGEFAIVGRFWGRPLDGEPCPDASLVFVLLKTNKNAYRTRGITTWSLYYIEKHRTQMFEILLFIPEPFKPN